MSADCAICLENLQSQNDLSATTCGHVFHHRCLRRWFGRSRNCPECRRYLNQPMARPLYIHFTAEDPATIRNMESRMVDLQRNLDMRNAELAATRLTNDQLRIELNQLRSQLTSKTEDAEMALERLKAREDEIRYLEDSAKADKEQQTKLIEELTARLETSNRKLESELEKRANLVSQQHEKETVPEARAVKEEPGPSTEVASKPKRALRKPLSEIDLNSDTQASRRKLGYLKRPR